MEESAANFVPPFGARTARHAREEDQSEPALLTQTCEPE